MVTIIGNGMGEYDFENIDIDFSLYDEIVCDKSFKKVKGDKIVKKRGFREARDYILENYRDKNILYVVTGSPFFFSAGILLAKKLPKEEVKIINNTSCKTYMQEKLFINESEIDTFSLHGRPYIDLTKFLTNRYTFILCDRFSIQKLQKAIKFLDKKDIRVTIGYKLGFDDEVIEEIDLFNIDYSRFDIKKSPYVILIEKLFTPKLYSDDEDFITERGMITKKYKRDLALHNLDLEPNQIVWDIGAGSGSCGIEAYKRYRVRTLFFEKNPIRVENIKRNLKSHRVVECEILEGKAETLFETIEENPQRIFVGGGGEEVLKRVPYLYQRVKENGVILINIITLKHLSLIIEILNREKIPYQIFSLNLTTYKSPLDLAEPQRELFSLKIIKRATNS